MLNRIDIELNNMKYISRSYLTKEEEMESMKLGSIISEDKNIKVKKAGPLNKNKLEDKYFDSHFQPLKDTKKWE